MTNLDINTPKGQITLTQEDRAVAIFNSHFPNVDYVHTPKHSPAVVDAILSTRSKIKCVVETKCRRMTRSTLESFNNEWLITYAKLEKAQIIAKGLGVPLMGFLYLVDDDLLILVELTDEFGDFLRPMRIESTETQETVNGGSVIRDNAYVDITGSLELSLATG